MCRSSPTLASGPTGVIYRELLAPVIPDLDNSAMQPDVGDGPAGAANPSVPSVRLKLLFSPISRRNESINRIN